MEEKTYKNRIADDLIELQLESSGIVLIEGAKWCGKTTTALQHSRSVIYMDDPDKKQQYARLAETGVSLLLEGDNPRLIDEWQLAPQLWDACRFAVDRRGKDGQFILTGSTEPISQSQITHSGTGRVGWVKMRPMSLFESGDSNGAISLQDLFINEFTPAQAKELSLQDLAYLVCRGGWPNAIGKTERAALRQAYNYIDAIAKREMKEVDDSNRSETSTRKLLRSYARHQGTQASIGTIAADLQAFEDGKFSDITITSYLKALRALFVIEDMEAWNPNLRSKAAVRTTDTRYFVDSSIACASLGIGPKDLINDLQTLGLLFETMAVRDLRVYAETLDGKLFHYRDSNGLECDAVIHLQNGSYGLIEIKLGGDTLINEGAKNLMNLASKLDTDKMKKPSFLMVLTGVGQYAYQRADGVIVVPLSSLKN